MDAKRRDADSAKVAREIVWTGIRSPSLDYCCVQREKEGWRFSGTVVAKLRTSPIAARYEIFVDKKFKTQSLVVDETTRGRTIRRKIEFRKGTWFVDGEGRNDLEKCSDVDLEASPCTNTPPIRRSRLKIGQRIDLTAAWVRLPSLKVMPLKQSYERRNAWKYLY
ncbi:MAG TPA: putative glycolipid-binding domain-containing protein, partial [Candidatus Bathyarchaeia archaeon]|nr:putative glycolipid-binding domain-containing protein [Candidatus Bathyarchaeia archaeon]